MKSLQSDGGREPDVPLTTIIFIGGRGPRPQIGGGHAREGVSIPLRGFLFAGLVVLAQIPMVRDDAMPFHRAIHLPVSGDFC